MTPRPRHRNPRHAARSSLHVDRSHNCPELQEALLGHVLVTVELERLDEVVEQVIRSLEFSTLAKYAFGLAQLFNAFYHRYPILSEEQADRKRWRAAGVSYVSAQLTRALDLMGIEVPVRM